jgi:alkylation response protein AidB-like acyl-CoA dehydrogenase
MATAPKTDLPVLELRPSDEERMMRETVRGICKSYGPGYARKKIESGEPPTELWDELASRGYMGVNVPAEYGGGGLGMRALAAVAEEMASTGNALLLIVVSPAIAGSILAKHGTEDRRTAGCAASAPGRRRSPSRSPRPTPARTRTN